MQIVNKTPHALNVVLADGSVRTIQPTLPAPRVSTKRFTLDHVDGIPVDTVWYGEIIDLPDEVDGVMLVVSALVAAACKRKDLLVVGEAVRDADGKIVGCKGLSRPG